MPAVPFQASHAAVDLQPAPIFPEWIVGGSPQARAAELCRSRDGSAFTVVWDCTAGSFDWTYNCDETIHIVEGAVVLSDSGNPPTRFGSGDIVFFPKGSQVHWEVEGYVRKVAFFRRVLPNPLNAVYKQMRRMRALVRGASASDPMGIAAAAQPVFAATDGAAWRRKAGSRATAAGQRAA